MQIKNLWTGEHHHVVFGSRYNAHARSSVTEDVREEHGLMSSFGQASEAATRKLQAELQSIQQVRLPCAALLQNASASMAC